MKTFNTRIEIENHVGEEVEVSVEVSYNYSKGCRGARDSLCGGAGPPLEPDEPPSVEIVSVITAAGVDIRDDLDDREREELEERCFLDAAEAYEREEEDRAAAGAERLKDDQFFFRRGGPRNNPLETEGVGKGKPAPLAAPENFHDEASGLEECERAAASLALHQRLNE